MTDTITDSEVVSPEPATNGHDVSQDVATNGEPEQEPEQAQGQEHDQFFAIIKLPHKPHEIKIIVSSQDQIQDIRQQVIEQPDTFQYSCFHLEHKGVSLNDFLQLQEVNGLSAEPELTLVEDPYTEKEARIHVIRVRELIGAAGDRTDTLQGILPGVSLFDSVNRSFAEKGTKNGTAAKVPVASESQSARGPMADFDFKSDGELSNLIPQSSPAAPKTVKSISVSPWNPPPSRLRQKGHLMYLQLMTAEGESHQITSHVTGFYVNKCTNSKFDPFPRTVPKSHSAHSLLRLISDLSPSFQNAFLALQEYNTQRDALATFTITNAVPASPWIVPSITSPLCTHQSDLTRTQESYLITGVDSAETLRDWNEEFQTLKELPKESAQDRVFRERLTNKLFADYNEAAARGAVLVARGEVAPLNPTEERDAQIFVYNNIFFSFGADGVGTFASEGGDAAARVATGKDVRGVRMVNQFDIDGLFTPATVVVDYLGKRVVGQSIVPGIFKQREPGENQIDYGAVDGKDIIAADERFAPVFEKLSRALKVKKHAVWDKSGKRFDLEGSVETKGLLGTDGRKYVLDVYRVTPLDILWMEENGLAFSSPEKTNGDIDHAYPHRMTVLRPELIDAVFRLRLEKWVEGELKKRERPSNGGVVSDNTETTATTDIAERKGELKTAEEADAEIKAAGAPETSKTTESKTEETPVLDPGPDSEPTEVGDVQPSTFDKDHIDPSEFKFSLNPDAFSGQVPTTDAEREELESDEQEVRAVGEHLRSVVLPKLITQLNDGDAGFPMDGLSLSRLLHKRGINIRYLGRIANLAVGKRLQALRYLSIQEMIARSFKHIAAIHLRHLPIPFTSACIAHMLNCLLGTGLNKQPEAECDRVLQSFYSSAELTYKNITPETLKSDIELQTLRRYRYTLSDDWTQSVRPQQLLREIALKLGLQLELKEYQFTKSVPSAEFVTETPDAARAVLNNEKSTNSKKKKNKAVVEKSSTPRTNGRATQATTFTSEDIVNVVPIVKEASPRSVLADEALEAGRISISQGQKKLGQELLLESLSLHEQIYGILHPEVARVYNSLSMLYYNLGEKETATELARKAVVVFERTLGVDNSETLLAYLNLGLFEHATEQTSRALAYIRHALELWKIIYGPSHPDSITTFNNAAVMIQHLKLYHESRLWFEASLEICEDVFGPNSINAATLLFQLGQALALDKESKGAVARMRASYNIFLAELGPEDKNTKEAEHWLEQLIQNAVNIARHAKDIQTQRLRHGVGTRVPSRTSLAQTPAMTPLPDQTVQAVTGRVAGSALDSRSIEELLKFIEGKEDRSAGSKKRTGQTNPKKRGGNLA